MVRFWLKTEEGGHLGDSQVLGLASISCPVPRRGKWPPGFAPGSLTLFG